MDNFKIEFESFYNEVEDGIYDYIGDKDVRKRFVNDIYNYVLIGGLLDLLDYDVVNCKNESSEGNIYDCIGVREDLYGKF